MDQHVEFGHGFGTGFVATRWHHGGLIPATDRLQVVKTVQMALMLLKALITHARLL
jgi:hypothetical protein